MGNWTGPTVYPATALTTTSAPVTAIAASGATWRQSSPDAAATARTNARTSTGRYGGVGGRARRDPTAGPPPPAPRRATRPPGPEPTGGRSRGDGRSGSVTTPPIVPPDPAVMRHPQE